ncbi:catecholate siderophore receptor Fiu [Roseateles sp. BYS180W]|uniref:Catecholate siderophore receptor Fiu n=1 Tax=Roseateles rivi TaxID=3299028 RepID=A0ABW7FT08_9BURK
MSYIKSRKHAVAPWAALATSLSLPLALHAQTVAPTTPAAEVDTLPAVKAKAKRDDARVKSIQPLQDSGYKLDASASSKLNQPLLETPKTVQIIGREVLREQGAADLVEALRNTPGITMQLGENGNTSAGDTFQMRGFSAHTSTFVDGVRDLGAVSRDVFNVEQVEVVKGPAGADIGRGASAGYINVVSKLPQLDTLTQTAVSLGGASRKRATVDANRRLGENTAVRLNLMWQDNDVPGRDLVSKQRRALAPALAFGLGTPTRLFLYSQHVRQNNVPDGGTPSIGWPGFYNADAAVLNAPKVDRHNYYGSALDREKVEADMATVKLEMELDNGTAVRNISRYGRSRMDRVLTGIMAINAVNPADPRSWTISRTRQRVDQVNEILANQTGVLTSFNTWGLKHDVSAGVEFMFERQSSLGFATTGLTVPAANLYSPNPADALPIPFATGAQVQGQTLTQAVYALDTVSLSPSLKLTLGLRSEHFNLRTTNTSVSNGVSTTTQLTDAGWMNSWNLGLLYKLGTQGTVYASAANSLTPPGSNNFALSTSGQAAGTADPQETTHLELGSKWGLLDKRLNLSAALFRTVNDGQITVDAVSNLPTQDGKTRVQGVELNAVGQLTNFWQISAGLQTMDAKQLQQRSATAVTDGVRWTPKFSATLWTGYQWGDFTVGGGLRHVGTQKRVITVVTTPQNTPNLPSHTVVDAMAAWRVSPSLNLQLNVGNVLDAQYMSSLNNGGSRLNLGAPRSAKLTANFSF